MIKYKKIPSQLYVFQSEDEGSTDFLKQIPAPKFLEIKIGVPVMLLINMSNKLVNGRVGIVTEVDVSSATITVQFEIENKKVHKVILAKGLQFPLKFTYAVKIHKSQGMTLNYVAIDCSYASTPGQIGVAVGRVKTINGLMVNNVRSSLIKTHPNSVYKLYEQSSMGEIKDDFTCCKVCKEYIDENNNSDSFGTPKDYTCVNSDDCTYNYFEEKISPSEFSDIELEVFEIIDEMEMPDSISNIFNEAMNYFSDTPLHDVPQNMKKETLSWLLLFSQWQEKQVNKFSEIRSRCFPRAKHNLLQKILTNFTRMLILICNLQNIKLQLKNFLLNTKLLRTNQFTKFWRQ
jgi:hypothetical protein